MPGAGLPLGGISDPRTRASTRLQVGRALTTLSGVGYALRSTFAAAVLPWWQATQYVFSVDWTESKEAAVAGSACRSEEHTSELQSQSNLVCRLLLEKKKKTTSSSTPSSA